MTPQEINILAETIIRRGIFEPGFLIFLIAWPLITALGAYFVSYLHEKGKNAATHEDIKCLTTAIEEVKHSFAQQIEALRGRHQLRMAAADRRLEVHQYAFSRWFKMFGQVHQNSIRDLYKENQEWWADNCLYLSPVASLAFMTACQAALFHADLLKMRVSSDKIQENWEKIASAGNDIRKGADLPALGESEFKALPKWSSNNTPLE